MQSHHNDASSQHDPAEDWSKPKPAGWCGRSHLTIIALGCPTSQDEHLIGLQSAVARAIGRLIHFQLPRLRTPRLVGPARLLRQLF